MTDSFERAMDRFFDRMAKYIDTVADSTFSKTTVKASYSESSEPPVTPPTKLEVGMTVIWGASPHLWVIDSVEGDRVWLRRKDEAGTKVRFHRDVFLVRNIRYIPPISADATPYPG